MNEIPPSVLKFWQARYIMEPWDIAEAAALADCKYEPPDWIQDMKEDHQRRMKAQGRAKRRSMSSREIRLKFQKAGW